MAEKYLPLYRKYRPSTFYEVVGQQVVVKTLLNAIEHNRVAHAYLFCGPRGTGKTSIARIFAKTLNCQNLVNGEPCGKCPHCLDMNNTISMDVIEIDAASNRKVEDARNLLEKVQFTPVLGKNKIYIIDEVHMLTTEAFNTLLKTLEEPPENLIFILATTEAHKVLETIVSRCQKFDFRRISVEDIKGRLKEISEKENINIDDDAIEFIARRSAGGLRDALALLDQSTVLALDNKTISKKDIITLLGSVDDEDLYNLVNFISQKNPAEVITLLKNIIDKGNDPNQIIKELIGYFRNLMLASVCKTTEEVAKLLDISNENCGKILEQSKAFSSQELAQIIEQLAEQERNIRNSSNPYLYLDVAVVDVTTRENILAQKALIERIENLEKQLNSGFRPKINNIQPDLVQTTPTVKKAENIIKPTPATIKQEEKIEIKAEDKPSEVQIQPTQPVENVSVPEPEVAEQFSEKPVAIETPKVIQQPQADGTIELNWDTFLGEVDSKPLFALLKMQARPITLNSEKIELAFKMDNFIEKAKQKKSAIEDIAKKLCGKVPNIIFRKLSDEDFKKKIAKSPSIQQSQPEIVQVEKEIPQVIPNEPITKEAVQEIENEIQKTNTEKVDLSKYDLPDDTRQIMEIFSGKFID